MRIIGWHKEFKENASKQDVASQVRKLETSYWVGQISSVFVVLFGLRVVTHATNADLKQIAFGLVITLAGIIAVFLNKLRVGICLLIYRHIRTAQSTK